MGCLGFILFCCWERGTQSDPTTGSHLGRTNPEDWVANRKESHLPRSGDDPIYKRDPVPDT